MTARNPLPERLGRAFVVADALRAGASRTRLSAGDLSRPFHGIRSRDADPRFALTAAMADSDAFSGPTAARIWDLPLPLAWSRDERLFVTSGSERHIRRPGVVVRRRPGATPVVHGGLPVLDPIATWLSLGAVLTPWDLTAVADRLVSGTLTTPAVCTVDELARGLSEAGRFPGVVALRSGLADVRVGSWSRPETLLRILLVRAGLPEPQLNVAVRLDDGRIGYADLAWAEWRVALEYDGRWHEDASQWSRDAVRRERFADAGWVTVHIRSAELFDAPTALLARVMRRLTSRGARLPAVRWARMPRFVR